VRQLKKAEEDLPLRLIKNNKVEWSEMLRLLWSEMRDYLVVLFFVKHKTMFWFFDDYSLSIRSPLFGCQPSTNKQFLLLQLILR